MSHLSAKSEAADEMNRFLLRSLVISISLISSGQASEDLLQEGLQELQVGNYVAAQKWFEKILEAPEVNEEWLLPAYVGLSRRFAEQGQYGNGIEILKQGVERLPDSSRLWARLAELHFQTGDYDHCQLAIRRSLDLNSQDLVGRLIQAYLLTEQGEVEAASAEFRAFVRNYNRLQPTDWETLVTIGEGSAVYARWESVSPIFRFVVNTLCPDALQDNKSCWQALVLSGNLLLEKYNAGQALPEFHAALEINPQCAEALVAMAGAALQDSKLTLADGFADRALKCHPNHLGALHVKAAVQLLQENEYAAAETLAQARAVNPRHQVTLGYLAAIEILHNIDLPISEYAAILDSAAGEKSAPQLTTLTGIWQELLARNPRPGSFLETVGAVLDARRKYELAEIFYRKSIEVMPQLSGPQTSLGMLYMRTGKIDEAETILNAAFQADPFHVRVNNMRKVINVLKSYQVVESEHFVVRAAESERLLAKVVSEYLEEIYPELVDRYGYEPLIRSQFEIYSAAKDQSGHAWFSTRMIGLPWIQTVGASTGKIVALTSPNESVKRYNWMRVVRHEFVHVLTLQKTNFNIPHWFTEAISVTEEKFEMPVDWQKLLLKRSEKQTLFTLANLNQGFQRPESPDDWTLAYCQSYLYALYMQEKFGDNALRQLLDAYQSTSSTPVALETALSITVEDFEEGYQDFLEGKLRTMRRGQPPLRLNLAAAEKLVLDSPEDASAAAQLAYAMFEQIGFQQLVIDQIQVALALDERNHLANGLLALALLSAGKTEDALARLEMSAITGTQDPFFLQVQAKALEKSGKTADAEEILKYLIHRFFLEDAYSEQLLKLYDVTQAGSEKTKELLVMLANRDVDDVPSRKRLARMAAQAKNHSEAIYWSREGIAVDVRDSEMHRLLAQNYVAQGDRKSALKAYENLLLLEQSTTDDQLEFARLLRLDKQHSRAASVLRQLLQEDPTHTAAQALLKIIEINL